MFVRDGNYHDITEYNSKPEIMAPLRYAMCFINSEQTNPGFKQICPEPIKLEILHMLLFVRDNTYQLIIQK